jgi:hypothetical protein
MTRREFSAAFAGLVFSPTFVSASTSRIVILEAIAGARLPGSLAIATDFPEELRQGVWELRTYRGATPALATHAATVFRSAGIRPLLSETKGENLSYFIPFENLAARDRAWTALNADPQWVGARAQFQSYHFGLYRSV